MNQNDKTGIVNKRRRPLGNAGPYSEDHLMALRDAFMAVSKGDDVGRAALFDQHWPDLKSEAYCCGRGISIRKLRKSRRHNPNARRRLRAAVKRGDIRALLKDTAPDGGYLPEVWELLQGAMEFLEKIVPSEEKADYEDELARLQDFDSDALNEIYVALKKNNVWPALGRPSGGPLDDFAVYLCGLYHEISGRRASVWLDDPTGEWKGRALPFFTAAIKPFRPTMKPKGVSKLIKRARERLPEC